MMMSTIGEMYMEKRNRLSTEPCGMPNSHSECVRVLPPSHLVLFPPAQVSLIIVIHDIDTRVSSRIEFMVGSILSEISIIIGCG